MHERLQPKKTQQNSDAHSDWSLFKKDRESAEQKFSTSAFSETNSVQQTPHRRYSSKKFDLLMAKTLQSLAGPQSKQEAESQESEILPPLKGDIEESSPLASLTNSQSQIAKEDDAAPKDVQRVAEGEKSHKSAQQSTISELAIDEGVAELVQEKAKNVAQGKNIQSEEKQILPQEAKTIKLKEKEDIPTNLEHIPQDLLIAKQSSLSEAERSVLQKVIGELQNFYKPVAEFVAGAIYQWLYQNGQPARWLLQTLIPGWNGLERDVERGLPKSPAFEWGRTLGDGAAIVTGIAEILGGSGAVIGGGALCIIGVGCIGGAPAVATGLALGIHGGSVASSATQSIAERLGIVFSTTGDRNSESGSSALNWNWKSTPTFGHTFLTHGKGSKNTKALRGRAARTGDNQGQWLDNQKAADFLRDLRPNIQGPATVEIPTGLGQVILPDGQIVPATHAVVVPIEGRGYKTAFPIITH